mgnify:FL=1|jgi:hypothetical protein
MSKIEVNTIDVQCGSTLTLGSSGKTVSLASGSSIGGVGTVSWCTTAKTSPFTATSGNGFFVNTACGAVTVTLPGSPTAGSIVAFKDYSNSWDSNAVTLCRNGSKICGVSQNANLNTESQSVTLIYVDGTKGWQDIHDSTANVQGNPGFIEATGGTVTTCGDFKIHTFTSDGNFIVSNTLGCGVGAKVSYLVVAGGGGAGGDTGGGGGAGGFREGKQACGGYTASPLAATPCSGLPVSVQTYPITVGGGSAAGGAPTSYKACNGSNSVFSTITSAGGGGGGGGNTSPAYPGRPGGAGGGGARSGGTGGTGNTPPVSPAQGFNGGNGQPGSTCTTAGGGGGALAVGGPGNVAPGSIGTTYSVGGAGAATLINPATGEPGPGPSRYYSGGGAGGVRSGNSPTSAAGGVGGGGNGSPGAPTPTQAGTANTGGGGGANCGAGGSGIVVIRYKFQ